VGGLCANGMPLSSSCIEMTSSVSNVNKCLWDFIMSLWLRVRRKTEIMVLSLPSNNSSLIARTSWWGNKQVLSGLLSISIWFYYLSCLVADLVCMRFVFCQKPCYRKQIQACFTYGYKLHTCIYGFIGMHWSHTCRCFMMDRMLATVLWLPQLWEASGPL